MYAKDLRSAGTLNVGGICRAASVAGAQTARMPLSAPTRGDVVPTEKPEFYFQMRSLF